MPIPAPRAVGAPALCLALLAALPACHRDPSETMPGRAVVVAPLAVPAGALRVQTGRRWLDPNASVPVGPDGAFVVGADVRLATVFADRNQNGRLDRFAEPSAPCRRTARAWSCRLQASRLFVHRLARTDPDGAGHDRTLVVAEAYDERTGAPVPDATLCDDRGRCAVRQTGPYAGGAPALMLALCDLDAGATEAVDITLDPAGGPVRHLAVGRPPALHLRATARRRADGALELAGTTDAPIDRAVVWLGRFDQNQLVQVVWSSEHPHAHLALTETSATAAAPAAAVRACLRGPGQCRAAIQTAAAVPGAAVPTFTQAEAFVEVPL